MFARIMYVCIYISRSDIIFRGRKILISLIGRSLIYIICVLGHYVIYMPPDIIVISDIGSAHKNSTNCSIPIMQCAS